VFKLKELAAMSDTITTPVLSVQPEYEPYLKLVNPKTGQPDNELAISFIVEPKGFNAATAAKTQRVHQLILDDSGSMQGAKAAAAAKAVDAWLDALPLGDLFDIIKFGNDPSYVFPVTGRQPGREIPVKPVEVNAKNIAAAKAAARGALRGESGGTYIGKALLLCRQTFQMMTGVITECLTGLVTDGESSRGDDVNGELDNYKKLRVQGQVIKVYPRGVGVDERGKPSWDFDALKLISDATQSDDPITLAEPAEMIADFKALAEKAGNMALNDVVVVIKMAPGVELLRFGTRSPAIKNFGKDQIHKVNEQLVRIPLGSIENEQTVFFAKMGVKKPATNAAGVCTVTFEYKTGTQPASTPPNMFKAEWTGNSTLSKRVNKVCQSAEGAEAVERAQRDAIAAAEKGDFSTAEAIYGEQVKIAHENDDKDLLAQYATVVDIIDAAAGKVKMKATDGVSLQKAKTGASKRMIKTVG
jgi:hypothetical protein